MNRSIFFLFLITLFAGCSSAPRTVLRLETSPLAEAAGVQMADGGSSRHSLVERPRANAIWVKGEYYETDGRQVWVPGHWRDTTAIAR